MEERREKEKKIGRECCGWEKGQLGAGSWDWKGVAPLSRGCDGDDANQAQEQKSGSNKNQRCQGTAPRLGTASGPQDSGEARMQKLLSQKKKRKRKKRAVPREGRCGSARSAAGKRLERPGDTLPQGPLRRPPPTPPRARGRHSAGRRAPWGAVRRCRRRPRPETPSLHEPD